MKPLRAILLALAIPCALCTPTSAAGKKDSWLAADKLIPALRKAAKDDIPVAILYQDVDGWDWGRAKFENMGGLKGVIKVRAYSSHFVKEVNELWYQVTSMWSPSMLFTDGQGNLIAYIRNDSNSKEWRMSIAQAKAVMKWKKRTRKSLDKAEKQASEGPFAPVFKTLSKVESEDKKWTAKIRKSYIPRPDSSIARRLDDPDLSEKERERLQKRRMRTVQMFFRERINQLRKTAKESVEKTYKRAEELLYGGSPKDALATLQPLLTCRINEATNTKIAQLKKSIQKAIRSGVSPKREEEEEAAPEQANSEEPKEADTAEKKQDSDKDEKQEAAPQ